jgi:hypothetical protein
LPHDPVLLKQDVVLKDIRGGNDRLVLTKYEAPSTPDSGIAYDQYKEQDLAIAKTMMSWLERHFPGHLWGCVSDIKQGIVKFNIPILMGFNNYYVVNLATHDICDGMAKGAGEILERYRLPRGRFELDPFLEAREKHSCLVLPSRKVPN